MHWIIFQKNREKIIESLQFYYFLSEVYLNLEKKYSQTKNPLIKKFLKFLNWFWSWQHYQIKDYEQLLMDYPFWKSRKYYFEKISQFLSYEITALDFTVEIIYPIRADTREARELITNFRLQKEIILDYNSLKFSQIFLSLTPILEGFDEDTEQSFFTEEEFRQSIKNAWVELEKYCKKKNENLQLQFIMLFFTVITAISYLFLKPEVFKVLSIYFHYFTN